MSGNPTLHASIIREQMSIDFKMTSDTYHTGKLTEPVIKASL